MSNPQKFQFKVTIATLVASCAGWIWLGAFASAQSGVEFQNQEIPYWQGDSTLLEFQEDSYTFKDAQGKKQSGAIADLKEIRKGILFDGKRYWCHSEKPPYQAILAENETVDCTAEGWVTRKISQATVLAQGTGTLQQANQFFKQGTEQYDRSQFDQALKSWEQALAIYRQLKQRKEEGETLRNLGRAYYMRQEYAQAKTYVEQGLAIAREVKNRKDEGRALNNLGLLAAQQKNFETAIAYYEQSIAIAREVKDAMGEGISLDNLGDTYQNLNKATQAIDTWQKSLAIYRQLKQRSSESYTLGSLGIAYYRLKDYQKSIEFHQQSIAIDTELKDRSSVANSWRNIGLSYQAQRKFSEAFQAFEKSLAIRRELKDRVKEISLLGTLGNLAHDQQDYKKAIAYYEQSGTIAKENQDLLGEATSLENLGRTYSALKDNTKAIEFWQKSLASYRQLKRRDKEAFVLSSIGIAYYQNKNYQKSLEFHQQSLVIDNELKDKTVIANTLRNIGLAHQFLGKFTPASSAFEKSLALWRELKDRTKEAELLNTLGTLASDQKDYKKAIEFYEKSLLITRELKNPQKEALELRRLGLVYATLDKSVKDADKNHEKALAYYTEGLKIFQKLADQAEEGNILRDIAILHMKYNRFRPAAENFQKSLTIWRDRNDEAMEANVLVNLGNLYATRVGSQKDGFCTTAIEYYEQSLPILRKLKNQALEGTTLGGLGYCHEETKQHQTAIEYHLKSLEIARQTQNRYQEGLTLINLGTSYRSIKKFAQAKQSGEQGLAIMRSLQNPTQEVNALDQLATTYAAAGEHQKAIDAQMQRIVIAQKHDVRLLEGGFNAVMVKIDHAKNFNWAESMKAMNKLYRERLTQLGFAIEPLNLSEKNVLNFAAHIRGAWISLGDAYANANDHAKALKFYQAALDKDYEKGNSYGFSDIDVLGKIGNTYVKMGRLADAQKVYLLALKFSEEFRTGLGYSQASSSGKKWTDADRIWFAERQVEHSQKLQQVLVEQKQINTALEIAEKGRARTFVELLSARIGGRPLDGKDLPPALKSSEIQQIAQAQNATLVQYSVVSPDLIYIWVIKPTGEIVFHASKLGANQSLDELVASSRNEMGVRGRSTKNPTKRSKNSSKSRSHTDSQQTTLQLTKLHQLLIDPIAAELPKDPNQRIIFIPQSELFMVPFAALMNAQGQYLIERHTLSTAPSIQTLSLTQSQAKKARSNGRSLIIGDPTMPVFEGTQLEDLPGARAEALAIGQMLNTQPLIGDQASKSAVLQQMKSAGIVHFATHGLLDKLEGDMPGAIALAPSGSDRGFLTASEIFDLQLNAKLVVLSACDTGRGDIKGDGVIGLSRSFVAAGVPSVVVSLWAVKDNSTSVLMSEFYRNLKTNPNKAVALRQAMLTTMKQYPQPLDWAAFSLIGEAE